jgi:phage FluMu protein Com
MLITKPFPNDSEKWNQIFKEEEQLLTKKIKCRYCNGILTVDGSSQCKCGRIKIVEGEIIATAGDYSDATKKLLLE